MDLVFWMGLAVGVFWAVGAYNRLVRLRAEANHSFGGLESHWRHQLKVIEQWLPAKVTEGVVTHSMDHVSAGDRTWIALRAASTQFVASLDATRAKPLDPGSVAALSAAQEVLLDAWRRVEAGSGDAGASMGPGLPQREWHDHWRLTDKARCQFNDAVQAYNAAIGQFPARILAWLFSFKPGRIL